MPFSPSEARMHPIALQRAYPADRSPARASVHKKQRIHWWALPLAAAALLAACSDKPASDTKAHSAAAQEPAKVGVITLQPERQTLTSALPGRTVAFMSADVRPQINGIVQKRLFVEGAQVKAGQPLYQIDAAPYQATEAAARAAVAKAKAQAHTAEVNAKRNAELVRIDAVSRQAYEESQAAAEQATADVAVAQAALETARINLRNTRVLAPIAGRTSLSNVNTGALVTANQADAMTTIAQLDPIYVDITQSSSELLQLRRDLADGRFQRVGEGAVRISIALEGGIQYPQTGRLQFSGITVNPGTGAVTLRAVVPNPDGVLMPGMYVQTLLPTGVSSDALLVPQQAVTRDIAGKASVLIVGQDRKVMRRPIEVNRAIGSRWLVESGVAAGDTLIVDGFQRIKEGDTVNPQPVKVAAAQAAGAATAAGTGGVPKAPADKASAASAQPAQNAAVR